MERKPIDREEPSYSTDDDDEGEGEEGEQAAGPATAGDLPNKASLRLDMGDEKSAAIVHGAVMVDKEPRRSTSVKTVRVEGNFVIADISAPDIRGVHKSTHHFLEMCRLSKRTIDSIGAYHLNDDKTVPEASPTPKSKGRNKGKGAQKGQQPETSEKS